jgi:transposase
MKLVNKINQFKREAIRNKYISEGLDAKKIANMFNVSITSVYKILKEKEFAEEDIKKRNKLINQKTFRSVLFSIIS